ncbi:hypothetical protein GGX14DRAFT_401573 [Mycena pura]|uniref:Alpha-type protein kinase domain-containing protein n=1 Tax=Mycena pura TaxID=153505 RepID=A0AAD6V0I5_9AGAR|nr:hypothetical protein GGX14DRAFT_401573 [Mycena pura]
MPPLSALLLAFALVFSESTYAFPLTPRTVNLQKSPSVTKNLILYRCTTGSELDALRKLGGLPSSQYTSSYAGDFNVQDTFNLYFWDDKDDAGDWCVGIAEQTTNPEGLELAIATYTNSTKLVYNWTAPDGIRVQRYEQDSNDWATYVAYNWDKTHTTPADIQKNNDWIEGPISRVKGPPGSASSYEGLLGYGMQHALVNDKMLSDLKVTNIGSNLAIGVEGLGGQQVTWRRSGLARRNDTDFASIPMMQNRNAAVKSNSEGGGALHYLGSTTATTAPLALQLDIHTPHIMADTTAAQKSAIITAKDLGLTDRAAANKENVAPSTYYKTEGAVFLSDLQGTKTLLTDPQIMTSPKIAGDTNIFGEGNVGTVLEQFPMNWIDWTLWILRRASVFP